MPKDPTKNIARYKIAGGEMNEFEFQQNQEQLAEQRSSDLENLIPGTPPEQRVEAVTERAEEVVETQANATSAKPSKKRPTRKATRKAASKKKAPSKKAAAKKPAAKKPARKTRTTKKAGKKGATKPRSAKKPARQRATKKKPATKSKVTSKRKPSRKK